ncbi:nitrate reductase [Flagellimonas zhangzhouensis]|uniref:nitrate reductase (cytochrome) n=1 Tax=Flagellimonas zhangzhouensis TaxID=1073328 RepID=A0A1H2YJZ9_9FLAO|nr:nitrate reductase [Allomuricauda zhangzhouensis]SDR02292.1 ferredoxin-nitrate reductase [Allomuricauda zhangzhouensis]SDX05582.1 ferredoxin-nitrate reductase [Allomuricauda zhangzhouensis]
MQKKDTFDSICSYCGVGCGITVKKDAKGVLSVTGNELYPVNKGMLCTKGKTLNYVAQDTSDRILYPEMRWSRNHPMQRVTWDIAFKRAAAVFKSIIEKHGPNSVGFYVSGQCLTEEYYLANKLTKGFLGTNNIDTNSRLCMSSAVVGYKKTVGNDAVPISYADIELADCFLIAGANPAWCHPILFRRIEKHKEENPNVKIIVVDPRKTQSCALADLHLQILPGTDVILFNAMARWLIEKKKIDKSFIQKHTSNFEAVKQTAFELTIRQAAEKCGISADEIRLAAKMISDAKGFISMWTMGLNQSVIGVDKNVSLLNLSLLTGQIGKPGSGPFSLTGQPNAMGGREVGGMASLLAAHRDLGNPKHRKEVQEFWGSTEIHGEPGYTATEMFDALESGKMKAVWIVCTNPIVSMPNAKQIEKALEKANFVIVQDISHNSETTKYADLLLPAAGWLEKEGTMTNSERRISYLPKVIDAPGEALPDVEILWRFAQEMGFHGFDYTNASQVYDEYCLMTKGTTIDISGLSYERLKTEGSFQWPVPSPDHKGTPRLFQDQNYFTSDGKAHFNAPRNLYNKSETTSPEFPLILNTGRVRDQWHTRTKTGKVKRLTTHIPAPFLEMNKIDAYIRGFKEGDVVTVKSRRGSVRVKLKINYDIREGVVFLPMHWGKILNNDFSRANNLTNNIVDPISKEPDFKYCAVQVEKYRKPFEKIVVVGAGAAAYRFVQSYREKNWGDTIKVFSKEEHPFYNRVLLPEYVNNDLGWEALQKLKEGELEKLKVELFANNGIQKIDKEAKQVIDDNGVSHDYDLLILATGSRAFVPPDVRMDLPGRFTMRERGDADRLKEYLTKTNLPVNEQHVVIIGGGLLGLELAAALKKIDINISIIQRSPRLMERQLDPISSRLLAEDVLERGIQLYFDNEVSTVFEDKDSPHNLLVNLKTGRTLNCNAIVYAIGTRPNINLAIDAGLKTKRGVLVDPYLKTSDASIFALGEIAEFDNSLFGITSAAEQQADIAANYILGDLGSTYSGSVLMNILKFENLDLCSIGMVNAPQNDSTYEEIILMDVSQRFYKKCIVKDDTLKGAILMGDKNEFAEFKRLIEEGVELSEKRNELLRGASNREPLKGKMVCTCSQVGDGNLKDAIAGGCSDFKNLCTQTGAGLGCGSCKPEVKGILDAQLKTAAV